MLYKLVIKQRFDNARVLIAILVCCSIPLHAATATELPRGTDIPVELRSQRYQVEVQTSAGWETGVVYVSEVRADGLGSDDQKGRSMNWTTFVTDVPVRVRVTAANSDVNGALVRPSRLDIKPVKTGDHSVEFTLRPGQKVSVEFPATVKQDCFTGPPSGIPCVMHSLLIFADRQPHENPLAGYQETEIKRIAPGLHAELQSVQGLLGRSAHRSTLGNASGKRVVVFRPGVHDLGYWPVPNNIEHVHIEAGAIVFGAIDVLPQGREPSAFDVNEVYRDSWHQETLRKSFQLTGHGILSGAKLPWHLKKDFSYHQQDHWWQHVKLFQVAAENITLRDVTLVDSPFWTVSFLNDTDTRSKGTFDNFKIVGAWTYNNDGLPVAGGNGSIVKDAFIHADDDAFKIYQSGARIENCVVWQNSNGAVFQFGWFPKTVRDVRVRGVDVIHNENWFGVNQNNRAVFNFADAGGKGVIEDIHFEDIMIEGKILRLFGLKPTGGQILRDWHFKNLSVESLGAGQIGDPGRNYFLGDIRDFHFEAFTIDGQIVRSPADGALDMGPVAGEGFTFQ